jgi:hypothetical protein
VSVIPNVHYAVPGVDQNTFADSLHGGNCLQAAVATILREPLDGVPNFYLFGPLWVEALNLYLGIWALSIQRDTDESGLTIAVGQSERGVKHCVVCVDGEMVHDPHPSRAGLTSIDYYLGLAGHDLPYDGRANPQAPTTPENVEER